MNKKIYKDEIKILNLKASYLVQDYELTNNKIKANMKGTLPYSLFSIKLQELGEKVKYEKLTNSVNSYAVVSVDFNCNYKVIEEEQKDEYTYLVDGNKVKPKQGVFKVEMKSLELREYIEEHGFNLIINNKKVHYVQLCRGASKAKQGSKLYIREDLVIPVLYKYLRMGITFAENELLDVPSWLTYEALLLSSITDTVKINLNNICVIDDVTIEYEDVVSVTKFENNELVQKDELYKIKNTPADGLCLINKNLTEWCYILLRNSFFKAAAISTDFEMAKKVLKKDYYIDMWGRKFENPDLIITPSCLKLFKFAYKFNSTLEMFEYWKKHCNGEEFGIVKHNKHSGKHEGKYGVLSYQVLNSLYTAQYKDILAIMADELQYIRDLRSEDDTYFKHYCNITDTTYSDDFINTMSSLNSDFCKTDFYLKYKRETIYKYVRHLKQSKINVKDLDYVTIFGLPQVVLREALQLKWECDVEGNVCYCSTYPLNTELFSWRNPHVSPGNVVILKNEYFDTDLQFFDKLNQSNVCILNTGRSSLLDAYSGADNDGDTIALTTDETLIKLGKEIVKEGLFKAPVNTIPSNKLLKTLSVKDVAKIDFDISKNHIGEIVNLSALILSFIGDIYNKDKNDARLKRLADLCNMMSVCSGIEIDKSKRDSKVKSEEIIKFVRKELAYLFKKETILIKKHKLTEEEYEEFLETEDKSILKKEKEALVRPNFFKFAQADYADQYAFQKFDCPCDFVVDILDNFKIRNSNIKRVKMNDLLIKNKSFEHANRHQIQTIIDKLKSYKSEYLNIKFDKNLDVLAKMIAWEELHNNLIETFEKMKITDETIYCMLIRMFNTDEGKKIIDSSKNKKKAEEGIRFLRNNRLLILNILCITHKQEFKKCFNNFKQDVEVLVPDEDGTIEIWGKKYRKEII